ncbi:MAG TPA: hypothetical protein VGR44_11375 [Methylomirabilota bacterium]|jgi:hypothetical protein|nr:hypothetical protein [Methylomirabilota bacterium]
MNDDIDLALALAVLTKGVMVLARRQALRVVTPAPPLETALTAIAGGRWMAYQGAKHPGGSAPATG